MRPSRLAPLAAAALLAAAAVLPPAAARAAGPPPAAQDDDAGGLKGAEAGMAFTVEGYERGLAFERYLVLTSSVEDDVGEVITVYRNASAAAAEAVAAGTAGEPYVRLELPETFFLGLSGDLIFLDSGTSAGPRGLAVYDLAKKKTVYETTYVDPVALADAGHLSFYAPTERKPTAALCPELRKWRGQQLGARVDERVVLDLKTLQVRRTGELACNAVE